MLAFSALMASAFHLGITAFFAACFPFKEATRGSLISLTTEIRQGIDNSIVELAVSVPSHFVIADGIEAMEGNGPLHGPMRRLGCLVFADDPVAADATCCRLMGIDPGRVRHLQMASPLGNLDITKIEQRGESVERVMQRFELLPEFAHLRG